MPSSSANKSVIPTTAVFVTALYSLHSRVISTVLRAIGETDDEYQSSCSFLLESLKIEVEVRIRRDRLMRKG
jgi:hypothetical protein